jgi:hypothetical protein
MDFRKTGSKTFKAALTKLGSMPPERMDEFKPRNNFEVMARSVILKAGSNGRDSVAAANLVLDVIGGRLKDMVVDDEPKPRRWSFDLAPLVARQN